MEVTEHGARNAEKFFGLCRITSFCTQSVRTFPKFCDSVFCFCNPLSNADPIKGSMPHFAYPTLRKRRKLSIRCWALKTPSEQVHAVSSPQCSAQGCKKRRRGPLRILQLHNGTLGAVRGASPTKGSAASSMPAPCHDARRCRVRSCLDAVDSTTMASGSLAPGVGDTHITAD
jgi:hypothetical protein